MCLTENIFHKNDIEIKCINGNKKNEQIYIIPIIPDLSVLRKKSNDSI